MDPAVRPAQAPGHESAPDYATPPNDFEMTFLGVSHASARCLTEGLVEPKHVDLLGIVEWAPECQDNRGLNQGHLADIIRRMVVVRSLRNSKPGVLSFWDRLITTSAEL